MKFKKRRSIRLKEYDYSSSGIYYVTICVQDRECLFGDVNGREMFLNDVGKMVKDNWDKLPQRFPNIELDKFIIMPNHIHGIINIVGAGSPRPKSSRPDNNTNDKINGRGNRAPTIGNIMAYFKYNTSKRINGLQDNGIKKIWQRNYYDHIIRNDKSLNNIRNYIINNPATWQFDVENPQQT